MKINLTKYKQDHPTLVDRNTYTLGDDVHDGFILYDNTDEDANWVAVSKAGEVISFGYGDFYYRYNDLRDWRKIKWITDNYEGE